MNHLRPARPPIVANPIEPLEGRRLLSAVVGLTPSGRLLQFDTDDVSSVTKSVKIRNLSAGDRVVGIDFRPSSRELYGLVDGTSVDRIIKIQPKTGKISTTFTLTTPLSGTDFDIDFNPAADALRVVSDAEQNLRVPFAAGPARGTTIADGTVSYGTNDENEGVNPNVVGAAYTNSFAGTTATVLYTIDSGTDSMNVQNSANSGTQRTRGPLGLDAGSVIGFDIEPASSRDNYEGDAYVSLKRAADPGTRIYQIDLATGSLLDVGPLGTTARPETIADIAIAVRTDDDNDKDDDDDDDDDRGASTSSLRTAGLDGNASDAASTERKTRTSLYATDGMLI